MDACQMPDSTSPHESDDESCKSSDINVQNNDAEVNINQEVPENSLSPLPERPMYLHKKISAVSSNG